MAQQQMARDERSLGELFTELAKDTSTLVRQEVALAQTEMTHKAVKAGKNIGFLVVGGAVAYAAALAVIAGVIIALGLVIQTWVAAILVGLVIGIAAYFMINSAITGLRRMDPVPHRTVETIKEDAKWLKNQVS